MEVIERTERVLKSSHFEEVFLKLNRINDESILFNTLDEMSDEEKREFEDAIIGLTYRFELKDEIKCFFNKYKNYALQKAKKNSMEYLNNNYLSFLYHNEFKEIVKDNNYDSNINDKSIWDIYYDLCDRYDEIIEKMNQNEELSNDEKRYIKNFFKSAAFYDTINKKYDGENDIMYDVVDYFNKYPIDNINTPEDKQFFLLYHLSKQLINIDVDTVITFRKYHDENDIRSNGYFKKLRDGRYLINISNLDKIYLGTEEEFFDSLFTIFHELGHLRPEICSEEYPNEIKEVLKREKYIIHNDNKFYKKYHDSFYMEIDADRYALAAIIDLFGNKNQEKISQLIDRIESKKRIYFNVFYDVILKKYEELLAKESIASNHKRS